MKILNLVIKNPDGITIRDIEFEENGLSLIYGKVNKPDNEKETSNSIGKTLLLKFIDYIFGANESSEVVKYKIHNWIIDARIKNENAIYNVKRKLGISELIVDNTPYELGKYREFFGIDRKLYNKQIFLSQKNHLISNRSEASIDDYTAVFRLLNLDGLSSDLLEYYQIQNKIKELVKLEKRLASFFSDIDLTQLEKKIFLLKQSIKEKEVELQQLDSRITNIQITKEKSEIMDEYSNKNYKLKLLQSDLQKLKIENKRLTEFLNDFKDLDVPSSTIKNLYDKAQFEIPDLVKKRLDEVENFQKSIFSDRKHLIEQKLIEILSEQEIIEKHIKNHSKEIERLANLISQNEIFQETMAIYKERSVELQNLMYEQGELSKIDGIINERKEEEDNLATQYNEVKGTYLKHEKLIEDYKTFIYDMVKEIYTEEVEAYFSIKLKNRHKRNRPFSIEMNLTGDTGEGVGEVRKLLIDLLILKYNNKLEMLIQDSACFSGIDNRQISNIIKLAQKVSLESKKQYIVSINDYQLNKKDSELIALVNKYTKLELDENEKLLKFNF